MDLRPGVTGVVFWYVQSVNSGTDSSVLVFLPLVPAETTVILMLGGTQAASSVMLRNGRAGCGGVGAFDGVGGTAFARHVELRIDMARMSPNMVENENLRRGCDVVSRWFEKKLRSSLVIRLLIPEGDGTGDPLFSFGTGVIR